MKRALTAEDRYRLSTVTGLDLSRSSGRVAYVVSRADAESDTYQNRIWSYYEGESRRLTSGDWDSAPRFNSDGSKLLFLRSAPKDKTQAWLLDVTTGDETPLAAFRRGVVGARWGTREVYVLAPDGPGEPETDDDKPATAEIRVLDRLDYRFNGRGWTNDAAQQVYRCSTSGGTPRLLTDGESDHSAFALNPDGSRLLVVATSDSDADLTGYNRVWSIDTVSGERTCLTPAATSWTGVSFDRDGLPIGVGWADATTDLMYVPCVLAADTDPKPLTDGEVSCFSMAGENIAPIPVAGGLLATANRRGAVNLDLIPSEGGQPRTVVGGPVTVTSFAADESGDTIYAAVATLSRPAELWKFNHGLGKVAVSLNDELLNEIEVARVETVSVTSGDGAEVEAWVTRPPSVVEANGAGLVYVHGGPFSFYGYTFFDEFQLAAAAGFTVIGGNPRGSDGYGSDWGWSIIGDLGGPDWDDVQALTDYLAGLDGVDENRIGIGGGSYGGFMSAWAIGHTGRYRAALCERGVYNWETFIGSSDIGTYFGERYVAASIETDLAEVRYRSPISTASRITTPSIIVHSEEDYRCPIDQAEQLFASLRRRGVEATFVRVPDENHELTRGGKPSHQIKRFELVHDFFRHHLT